MFSARPHESQPTIKPSTNDASSHHKSLETRNSIVVSHILLQHPTLTFYFGRTRNSMRLFLARLSLVSFEATGRVSP